MLKMLGPGPGQTDLGPGKGGSRPGSVPTNKVLAETEETDRPGRVGSQVGFWTIPTKSHY